VHQAAVTIDGKGHQKEVAQQVFVFFPWWRLQVCIAQGDDGRVLHQVRVDGQKSGHASSKGSSSWVFGVVETVGFSGGSHFQVVQTRWLRREVESRAEAHSHVQPPYSTRSPGMGQQPFASRNM
jgi:hypothetical protein